MEAMVKEIKGLQISDATARLMACIRTMQGVYGEVYNAMECLYGSKTAEDIITYNLSDAYEALEKGLQDCLIRSIDESLSGGELKSI